MSDVEAKQLIAQARHITIIGHVSPDGDAVGSILGLSAALSRVNKECLLVLPDRVPEIFRFLPGVDNIAEKPARLDATDLIIVLDASDPNRLGTVYSDNLDLFQSVPILNIDHHSTNSFTTTSAIIDPTAAATAELITMLLHELSIPLDTVAAICLLTAVVSDTQCFRTPSTTARSLEIAVRLMEAGASLSWVVDCLYKKQPITKVSLWGQALSTMQLSGKVVWACVTRDAFIKSKASVEETDGLVDVLAGVREATVAALFKEIPGGGIKISLRSSGDVDVAQLAAYFNGGGHAGAAGFFLDCSIEQAQELVVSHINRELSGN